MLFNKTKTTNTGQKIKIQYRFNIQEDKGAEFYTKPYANKTSILRKLLG